MTAFAAALGLEDLALDTPLGSPGLAPLPPTLEDGAARYAESSRPRYPES